MSHIRTTEDKPANADLMPAGRTAHLPPMAMQRQRTVLLVDDDGFMLDVLADMLSGKDCRVLCASSGEEALALLAREPVDVVVCDQSMPGMGGTELLERVAEVHPATVRLMLTGQTDLSDIEAAMARGAVDAHHAKPVTAGALRAYLDEALRLQAQRSAT